MSKELKIYEINPQEIQQAQYAIIQTNKGNMVFELFGNEAPQTVTNFVAQGGCPIGNGCGGPGYAIKCETQNNPHKHIKGALSMAHAGKDTGGSQFFICFAPQPHLDGEHTVFGQIIHQEGLKVLDSLKQGDLIENIEILEKNPLH